MIAVFENTKMSRISIVGQSQKEALVSRYSNTEGTYWNLCYLSNGAGKNFTSYNAVVKHLQNRGW